jgi:hypothetical protein
MGGLLPILIGALGGNLKGRADGIIRDLGKEGVDRKMSDGIPDIVAGMKSRDMTPEHHEMRDVVRAAMFRIWRHVIPSGTIADIFRDRQDDKVVPAVFLKITSDTALEEIVRTTKDEIIRLTF